MSSQLSDKLQTCKLTFEVVLEILYQKDPAMVERLIRERHESKPVQSPVKEPLYTESDLEDFELEPESESDKEVDPNYFYINEMCLKEIPFPITITNPEHIKKYYPSNDITNIHKKCTLPKGHDGKCKKNFDHIFQKNKITEKLLSSVDKAINYTPGNDDYVYKNRSSRLYPYYLTSKQEKEIRDKNIKKKCAIPKKDYSTSLCIAEAYIDWLTFLVNVIGVKEYINNDEYERTGIKQLLEKNKKHLIKFYSNRKIFDNDGNSICVITKNKINLNDIADIDRDNRTDIKDTDIQLGHNYPRSEKYISVRGCNLLPMSRKGNLLIGENVFTENKWIDELKKIVSIN